ncbi:receptor-like protein EIX2 [Henckelia pumila]|uniref:receptor-like protein EIX2 n=1 Tax=Henckelia pumila TaxID=405737 RepID=UPI003C6DE0B3
MNLIPTTKLLPLFFLLLFIFPVTTETMRCLEKERFTLLKIKSEMKVNDGWGAQGNEEVKKDCCRWRSVLCDNNTNHVVGLIFINPETLTKFSPSLLDLVDLIHLSFFDVDFNGIPIPEFIGSFGKLQHLNMIDSNIGGSIPHHLGNLSMLRSLDLSGNLLLNITDLDWLASLHSLEYLDLSYVDLSRATTWMQVINNLPKLYHLNLQSCGLQSSSTLPPSLPLNINTSTCLSFINLSRNSLNTTSIFTLFLQVSSSLSYVDFSSNYMRGKIPDALWNLTLLSHVDLSKNSLEGGVPTALWNFTMLGYVDLSENLLHGSLPNVLKLRNLEVLNLNENGFVGMVSDMRWCASLKVVNFHGNMFNGTLNARIGSLSKLEILDLGSNNLKGTISEAHLFNLSRLQTLDLSFNSNLTVKINSRWNPPFKLEVIHLAYCNLGPKFPNWILKSHSDFASVDISNARISDTIKIINSHGNTSFCFMHLNMSCNQISGIPPDLSCPSFESVDLSSNDFNGSLPRLSPNLGFVNLARNNFFGRLTNICDAIWVSILDLSDNQLSGDLPHCLMNLTNLEYLNLANNFFSGEIPISFGYMKFLSSLHLRNNNLGGEISIALRECSWLRVLDLEENKFYGNIPAWIGTSLPYLAVLSLKSNDFYGNLPSTLCHLQNLQVLDLSLNKISGTIPKCIGNFSSMTSKTQPYSQYRSPYNDSLSVVWSGATLYDTIQIIWKGKEIVYIRNLELLKAIDLSSNKFTGEIPLEMTSLVRLFALNISRNNLVGSIPPNIFQLELLNSLDLSQNNLSGHIPDTLSRLSHLGVLNLSFNNLSGRIPWDTHMQTFNSFSYLGNPELCGTPLSKSCPEDHETHKRLNSTDEMDNDELMTTGFYISMTLGFIFGFWGVLGTLILNKFCRHIWFKMLIDVHNWFSVKIGVTLNRVQRYFQTHNIAANELY